MGIDYKLLIVRGATAKGSIHEINKTIPNYSESTGERLRDKSICVNIFKLLNFPEIPHRTIEYWTRIDNTDSPIGGWDLKGLTYFPRHHILGQIVKESRMVDVGSSLRLEIPDMEKDSDWVALNCKLQELGVKEPAKLFTILEVC